MEILKVQGLKKRFTDRGEGEPVLSGASFRLEEGTFTALTGISGAGKTTLIHLLAGLQEPDGGQVYLLGRDLGEMKEEERTLFRRRHISLVLQEGALLPGLTVEENILLPMAMDTGRLVEEERLEQILEALGLTRLRRRPGSPAGSGSGWCWDGPFSRTRRSFWRTNPVPGWTGGSLWRSWGF